MLSEIVMDEELSATALLGEAVSFTFALSGPPATASPGKSQKQLQTEINDAKVSFFIFVLRAYVFKILLLILLSIFTDYANLRAICYQHGQA
jgi:hypothetical protein